MKEFETFGNKRDQIIKKGCSSFLYKHEQLQSLKLNVFYYAPDEDFSNLRPVFVLHGALRNAAEYRNNWIEFSNKYGLLIFVPHFSNEQFPGSQKYILGGIFDDNRQLVAKDLWTFSVVEPLFRFVKAQTKSAWPNYFLFGHSAGAQFLHRFLFFNPLNHVKKAIAANAGWYTLPDFEIEFPYGLLHSPARRKMLEKAFQAELVVLLGENDNNSKSKLLRHTPEADKQGTHRLARGIHFFKKSRLIAQQLNCPFNWQLVIAEHTGHNNAAMAYKASKLLFE